MIAKLIVWAPTRSLAIGRFKRDIDEYVIEGVPTTLPLLRALCDHEPVVDGTFGTSTLETFAQTLRAKNNGVVAAAAASSAATESETLSVEVNDKLYRVRVFGYGAPQGRGETKRAATRLGGSKKRAATASGNDVVSPMHGVVVELRVTEGAAVNEGDVIAVIEAMKMMNEIRAHKSGTIAKLHAAAGGTVEAGSPIASIG